MPRKNYSHGVGFVAWLGNGLYIPMRVWAWLLALGDLVPLWMNYKIWVNKSPSIGDVTTTKQNNKIRTCLWGRMHFLCASLPRPTGRQHCKFCKICGKLLYALLLMHKYWLHAAWTTTPTPGKWSTFGLIVLFIDTCPILRCIQNILTGPCNMGAHF